MVTRSLDAVVLFVKDNLEFFVSSIIVRQDLKNTDVGGRAASIRILASLGGIIFVRCEILLQGSRVLAQLIDLRACRLVVFRQVLILVAAVALRRKTAPVAMLALRHILQRPLVSQ